MVDKTAIREKFRPSNVFRWAKFKLDFYKNNPGWFVPDGVTAFVGGQGTGKTLSAINYVYKLMEMYPECKLVCNLYLTKYPIVTFEEFCGGELSEDPEIREAEYQEYLVNNRVFPFNNNDDFAKYGNGMKGVIFLVDEIQLYLNSLESKNINMEVLVQISQQRKQRKHIVCTSQVFGRMAKPLREQFSTVIKCQNFFGFLQYNQLIDRDSIEGESTGTDVTGVCKLRSIWFHNPEMYKRYDTYYTISRNKFVAGEQQREGVYGNTTDVKLSERV